jgi:hypothetical protein
MRLLPLPRCREWWRTQKLGLAWCIRMRIEARGGRIRTIPNRRSRRPRDLIIRARISQSTFSIGLIIIGLCLSLVHEEIWDRVSGGLLLLLLIGVIRQRMVLRHFTPFDVYASGSIGGSRSNLPIVSTIHLFHVGFMITHILPPCSPSMSIAIGATYASAAAFEAVEEASEDEKDGDEDTN